MFGNHAEYCRKKAQTDAERAAAAAAKEAAKDARRKAMVDLMERNYMEWHKNNEEKLAADIQEAEDKAAADAEARRRRWVGSWSSQRHVFCDARSFS